MKKSFSPRDLQIQPFLMSGSSANTQKTQKVFKKTVLAEGPLAALKGTQTLLNEKELLDTQSFMDRNRIRRLFNYKLIKKNVRLSGQNQERRERSQEAQAQSNQAVGLSPHLGTGELSSAGFHNESQCNEDLGQSHHGMLGVWGSGWEDSLSQLTGFQIARNDT